MNNIERKHIIIRDSERKTLHDRFGGPGEIFKPKTNKVVVEARDKKTGKKEVVAESTNLIVYHGRSWLMQRAFGFPLGAVGDSTNFYPWDNTDSTAVEDCRHLDFHNMYINWFAVGSGGADISSSPLEPYSVSSVEYELQNHLPIGGDSDVNPSGVTDNLRYFHKNPIGEGGVFRDYHQFDPQYPQFMFDPDIVPGEGGTEDPQYDEMEIKNNASETLFGGFKTDSYLRALIRVTISPEECNGPKYYDPLANGEEYSYLNEAGLFVSPSHNADAECFTSLEPEKVLYKVQLFAKVNFSTIRKDDTRELIFSWYIYF